MRSRSRVERSPRRNAGKECRWSAGRAALLLLAWTLLGAVTGCATTAPPLPDTETSPGAGPAEPETAGSLPHGYATVRLDASISVLTPRQQAMVTHLVAAASVMDEIFWEQTYGNGSQYLARLDNPRQRRLAEINYGPWDRFRGNQPIVADAGPKPRGGRFYPADMSPEEFASVDMPEMRQPRTVVRRAPNGGLIAIPYHEFYTSQLERAARHLALAAGLCDDPYFKRYLTLRARALITDDYGPSDQLWIDLRDNIVDLIIGPLDRQEDDLFGLKAAFAAWVLIRDRQWSQRLAQMAGYLPEIRRNLPFAGSGAESADERLSRAAVYDALHLAGAARAGPKSGVVIATAADAPARIPAKRVYLRNIIQARFRSYTLPLGEEMIVTDQRRDIRFDAYLDNLLAGDLGRELDQGHDGTSRSALRAALRDRYAEIESSKADAVGTYIIGWLGDHSPALAGGFDTHMVTFVAKILEDIHRAGWSARGRAAAMQFNLLKAFGGVTREHATGRYRVHPRQARAAMDSLAFQIMMIEARADYGAADALMREMGGMDETLRKDLERLSRVKVPAALVFEPVVHRMAGDGQVR